MQDCVGQFRFAPLRVLLVIFLLKIVHRIHSIDPAEFFGGAQHRPRLEILIPVNGEVLEDGDLTIRFKLDGYSIPSQLHGSSICVGLTNSVDFTEKCFDEVPDYEFKANGLVPGEQYALRIVLFERENAIAISVRSFRVGGIRGLPEAPDKVVTITTAVQVAMEYQLRGLQQQAEIIYRSVLSQQPLQSDALHLLGVLLYQRGDATAALPFIETALRGNKTYEGFHNSLGVCYRAVGRLEEAAHQFELALAMSPLYLSAAYNLGLTYQQMSKWDAAIHLFRLITDTSLSEAEPQLNLQVRMESKVRECDLLLAQRKLQEARSCLLQGVDIYPDNAVLPNELGNVLAQLGQLERAHAQYSAAAALGNAVAPLNVAHVLELQGFTQQCEDAFHSVLLAAQAAALPVSHIAVRLAILSPRIFRSQDEIVDFRVSLEQRISQLLQSGQIEVDNSPPLHFGYSTGNLLLYQLQDPMIPNNKKQQRQQHQQQQQQQQVVSSNAQLKRKLYQLYVSICPALQKGFFLEKTEQTIMVDKEIVGSARDAHEAVPQFAERTAATTTTSAAAAAAVVEGDGEQAAAAAAFRAAEDDASATAAQLPAALSSISDNNSGNIDSSSSHRSSSNPPSATTTATTTVATVKAKGPKIIRIGFVSRFLNGHPAGLLCQGLISILRNYQKTTTTSTSTSTATTSATASDTTTAAAVEEEENVQFEIFAFLVDGGAGTPQFDAVQRRIAKSAHVVYSLPSNHISACAQAIRSAEIDVLVYPELGLDPLSYFLSFARLAAVQCAWLGHPDTTGVPNVDYFISSDIEASGYQQRYLEQVRIMRNFGTQLLDMYAPQLQLQLTSPRTVLLNRAKFLEQQQRPSTTTGTATGNGTNATGNTTAVGVPKNAHLYMVGQSLITLNPLFDEVLAKLLLQDRLAYIVIVDVSSFRPSWQKLLLNRIAAALTAATTSATSKHSSTSIGSDIDNSSSNSVDMDMVKQRVIFFTPESSLQSVDVLQLAHVLLEPFPVTGNFQSSLEALAVGVPVLTLPSSTHVGGRLTLLLYRMLGYGYQSSLPADQLIDNSHCCTAQQQQQQQQQQQYNNSDSSSDFDSNQEQQQQCAAEACSSSSSIGAEEAVSMYSPLVVSTAAEYVQLALKLAHQPQLRQLHSQNILRRRDRLFNEDSSGAVFQQWASFCSQALAKATPVDHSQLPIDPSLPLLKFSNR